ncbi:MAG: hypothetical protein ACI8XO_002303, partial [Verrucomicrobiales bacterium]
LLMMCAGRADPTSVKLNSELSGDVGVGEDLVVISPDAGHLLYTHFDGLDYELKSVSLVDQTERLLAAGLQHVFDLSISPDSSTAVFIVLDETGMRRVMAVPITGGAPVDISGELNLGLRFPVHFVGDGSSVIIDAFARGNEILSLYRLSLSGGDPVLISSGVMPVSAIEMAQGRNTAYYLEETDNDRGDRSAVFQANFSTGATELLRGDLFRAGNLTLRGCQEISHTKMRRNFSQHQGRFQR